MTAQRKTRRPRSVATRPADWPRTLVGMQAEVHRVLTRNRVEPTAGGRVAWEVVGALAMTFGGRHVYLPAARRARTRARNEAIFSEWNGRNTVEVAERYGLTTRAVQIIAKGESERRKERHGAPLVDASALAFAEDCETHAQANEGHGAPPGDPCPHLWSEPDATGRSECLWCAAAYLARDAAPTPNPSEGDKP